MSRRLPLTDQDRALRAMTEATLQTEVIRQARGLGWGVTLSARKAMLEEVAQYGVTAPPLDGLIYHPRYSLGSEPGWPDLTLVRRRDRRLLFAELKSEKGFLSTRQAEVLELLEEVGMEVHIWRPSDLSSGRIAEVLR